MYLCSRFLFTTSPNHLQYNAVLHLEPFIERYEYVDIQSSKEYTYNCIIILNTIVIMLFGISKMLLNQNTDSNVVYYLLVNNYITIESPFPIIFI